MSTIRSRNLELLRREGFRVAPHLPEIRSEKSDVLRPLAEIASRLLALDAVFTWAAATEESAETPRLERYVRDNGLARWMTEEEREIIALPRSQAHAEHVDTIGWRLENMWSLAWVLGFEPAPGFRGQIPHDVADSLVLEFLPGLEATVQDLLDKSSPRPLEDVEEMEDRFYCLHNAVRSAQLGQRPATSGFRPLAEVLALFRWGADEERAVPPGFDPIADGGAVHERRHSLTWCLSPGVEWEDTDLNT